MYIQRETWRVGDVRSQLYELIKAHDVPGRIVSAYDQPSAAGLTGPNYAPTVLGTAVERRSRYIGKYHS